MGKNFNFSDQEKHQIEGAIKSLENEASGEIVLFFAKRSDNYIMSCWKSAAIFSAIPTLAIPTLSYYWLLPSYLTPFVIGLLILSFMIIGFIIPLLILKYRISFFSDSTINQRVVTKARDIFLEKELFNTIDRTGILIYISKLENKVQILGDSGINSKIESKDWQFIVDIILNGIKNDNAASGLVIAIDSCKKLLLDNGFVVREDDTNELKDDIIIE